MIKVYIVYIHSINNLNIVIFIYMSYTIKYVRLYESSPFKKIRIKDEDEDDKLKRIIKRHDIMKDSIFLKDIDEYSFICYNISKKLEQALPSLNFSIIHE